MQSAPLVGFGSKIPFIFVNEKIENEKEFFYVANRDLSG